MKKILLSFSFVLGCTAPVWAHFPILIHDTPFAELNQPVQVTFAVGHPFEQEYENAEKPAVLKAILPTGKSVDLLPELQEGSRRSGDRAVKTWSLTYNPLQKGDAILALDCAPEVQGSTLFQEFLKTFVHVDRQEGWRRRSGQPLEIVPLTRPYGIEAGDVFTARLMKGDQPVADTEVYIERFMPAVPKAEDLPPEPFITKVVATDPNGVFSCTLPQDGWWICAATVEDLGKVNQDGKEYSRGGLAGVWVFVGKPEN